MAPADLPPPSILPQFITTLPTLPGYRIVRTVGIVTDAGTGSGATAKTKAARAYREAMDTLAVSGVSVGGNAIVGLTISSFGSSIGGTAMGDAVGILLMGAAVVIEVEQ
ncbi:hypothetical protein [Aeromicrobium stalagmiti]|uniref:hypothetical protein n=1 Tax=Aeromicrobium stalagmiti TaxID=2738988 RepID=UPI0015693D7E|nr:hypothetical protein [Aeromicrobium stalagmiti]NRQ51562.1 hypothetical protein [Aeromicrobium stalagmiti]